MIRLQCACGRKIAAPDQWLGKRVKCPQCGQPVPVVATDAVPIAMRHAEDATRETAWVRSPDEIETSASEPTSAAAAPPATKEATAAVGQETEFAAESSAAAQSSAEPVQPRPLAPRPSAAELSPVPTIPSPASNGDLPEGDDEDDFYQKQKRLPRFMGTLGLLVAVGAGASCWVPQLDGWTLYIALAGVALSTIGFGVSMSRYRLGLAMPVLGLIASLAAMGLPYWLPSFGKIAPQHYVERESLENERKAAAEAESQRRGLLSVESLRLTGSKDTLAPEVAYKLINRTGKTIKQITGSLQLADRDHRPLGGLALNLMGPYGPNTVIDGKNEWTMEQATQSAIADKHFTADYKADQVEYTDGTTKNYNER